jgi:hypothetical protein
LEELCLADYFLLLDSDLFELRLRPALAASWRLRSFAPCRALCTDLLPRVEAFAARYHIAEGESLAAQVSRGLPFQRDFWRALVGELLFQTAEEIPEFQTCLDTLCCLLAPARYQQGSMQRSPPPRPHTALPKTPGPCSAGPPAPQHAPPPRPHTALPKTPGPCSAGPPAAGPRADLAPIEQVHLGSRDLTFGGCYRPDHCGYNNLEDVRRLDDYLSGIDPAVWEVENLRNLQEVEEEDRAEELEIARDWFPPLREMYGRAADKRWVIVHESL